LGRTDEPSTTTDLTEITTASNTSADLIGKSILFNETWIGLVTCQEDVPVAGNDDREMLWIIDNHRRGLKIDNSKEMMVGIAYWMPFELEQFRLFHVSMHIDATADSYNEGQHLVTVTSKDSFGKMFFDLGAFLPSEQSWAYKWLSKQSFLCLLDKRGVEQT
jgi:hypothetical protein